jgi:hypothetical protein
MKRKTLATVALTVGCSLTTTLACNSTSEQSTSTTIESTTTTITSDISELDAFLAAAATTTTTIPKPVVPRTVIEPGADRWDQLAMCECGGNWECNTGNGYFGGLQFTASAWTGFGGGEFATHAHLATREQQIIIGERILARMGWGAWPGCTRKFGWR